MDSNHNIVFDEEISIDRNIFTKVYVAAGVGDGGQDYYNLTKSSFHHFEWKNGLWWKGWLKSFNDTHVAGGALLPLQIKQKNFWYFLKVCPMIVWKLALKEFFHLCS